MEIAVSKKNIATPSEWKI